MDDIMDEWELPLKLKIRPNTSPTVIINPPAAEQDKPDTTNLITTINGTRPHHWKLNPTPIRPTYLQSLSTTTINLNPSKPPINNTISTILKIKELKEMNAALLIENDALKQENKALKKGNTSVTLLDQLIPLNYNCNITDISGHNVDDTAKILQNKFQTLQNKYDDLIIHHSLCNQRINKLKNDLAIAQNSILEMTNVVALNQKLPTIQETILMFHEIRDQQHHNTITKFKKYIKNKYKNKNYQKYYINQIIHQILFKTLIKCYNQVELFRDNMFNNISKELNMKNIINDNIDNKQNDNINGEIFKIISNRFGSYFKTHYKNILKLKDLKEQILKLMKDEYSQYFSDDTSSTLLLSFEKYIGECCKVCWIMILLNLKINPTSWNGNKEEFNDIKHKRMLGSDRKCKDIIYYIWPIITQDGVTMENQKMDVITRNKLYVSAKSSKRNQVVTNGNNSKLCGIPSSHI